MVTSKGEIINQSDVSRHNERKRKNGLLLII